MATATEVCSSIEGGRITFKTRQFYSKTPRRDNDLGKLVFPFKLGINSVGEIMLPLEVQPVDVASLTNVGDKINGTSIDGFSTNPISPSLVH